MKKLSVKSIDYVLDTLKILADNPYALLWELVEDFECNGHKISVKDSTQYMSAVIDNRYVHIGGNISITAYGKTYNEPLDYVRALLTDTLKESIDFGSGSEKEIREAINNASAQVTESYLIKEYSPNSKEYQNLQAAAALLSMYTGKPHIVKDTYFDHGQDWKWTTIIRGDTQILSPKEHEMIVLASSVQDLGKSIDKILAKKAYI